jgi:hypothetical protein
LKKSLKKSSKKLQIVGGEGRGGREGGELSLMAAGKNSVSAANTNSNPSGIDIVIHLGLI